MKLETKLFRLPFICRRSSGEKKSMNRTFVRSFRSSRLAIVVNNHLCIYSLLTSDELLSIVFEENSSDELNHLNCLSWSDNGKFVSLAHWSGLVSVYSSIDGQLIHRLASKAANLREDSFVEIWFSGSDASQ